MAGRDKTAQPNEFKFKKCRAKTKEEEDDDEDDDDEEKRTEKTRRTNVHPPSKHFMISC